MLVVLKLILYSINDWKIKLYYITNIDTKLINKGAHINFIECDLNEAKWIINNELRIANKLKLPIPKEFYKFKDII